MNRKDRTVTYLIGLVILSTCAGMEHGPLVGFATAGAFIMLAALHG